MLRLIINTTGGSEPGAIWATRYCGPGSSYPLTGCSEGRDPKKEIDILVNGLAYGGVGSERWDAVALHEVAHVLGFSHEFDRTDWDGVCSGAKTPGTYSGTFFTKYDWAGILNASYCHWTPELSALDRVGLAVVYPRSYNNTARGRASMKVANGLVLRNDDALVTDWTAAGAGLPSYTGVPQWTSSQGSWTGTSVPASYFSGTLDVSAKFTDFRGRAHTIPTTRFTRDHAKHAALSTMAAVFK